MIKEYSKIHKRVKIGASPKQLNDLSFCSKYR